MRMIADYDIRKAGWLDFGQVYTGEFHVKVGACF